MIKTAEASGKDVSAAAAAARKALGIGEDEGSTEVLVMPKKGFLGFGAVEARVRVSVEVPDEEEKKAEKPARRSAERAPKAPRQPRPAAKPAEAPAGEAREKAVYESGSREAQVQEFLSGLLERMDIEADIAITAREGGGLDVELSGKDMCAVIGRRGETLDAIQHLVNYALNRGGEKHMHISVDAENYRSKREDSLVHLAEKMAAKALKYKRSMALEPMNSYERHVIHTALQNYEGVTTSSIGTEPNRRVVVSCTEAPERRERPNRDRRDRRRSEKKSAVVERSADELPEIDAEPVVMDAVPAPESAVPAPESAAPEAAPAVEAAAAGTAPKAQPAMPEGYEPINKNKPTSREWC